MPYLLFLTMILGQAAFPEPIFLSYFPVTQSTAVKEGTAELDARVTERTFAELSVRRVARYIAPGRFVVDLASYPRSRDKTKKAYLACSFLVDCDEPSVKAALGQAERELGGAVNMPALTGWVGRYITKKTFTRDFDLASVVAARREGDCTEHAVLLAALARARKIPARVVTGLALIEVSGKVSAFGHAWVEWHDGKTWIPADAALSAEELAKMLNGAPTRVSYLPVRIVDREDAGFAAPLLTKMDVSDITGIVVSAPSASKTEANQAGPGVPQRAR